MMTMSQNTTSNGNEEHTFVYSMGPRAAVEIGRKQVVMFCADVQNEHADETMLMEYEHDDAGTELEMSQEQA